MIQDTELPADLTTAVRSAAAALPAPRADLWGVRAKARAYQRRRMALRAGVAVALIGLLAATVPALQALSRKPAPQPADPTPPAPRLLLTPYSWPWDEVPRVIAVIEADGTLTSLPWPPGLQGRAVSVAIPDGRIAILAASAGDESLQRLVVLARDGTVLVSRDLPGARSGPQTPYVLAVTNTEVFMIRSGRTYVAHDIATGAERQFQPTVDGAEPRIYSGHGTADRLVVWPARSGDGPSTCECAVLDPRTGQSSKVLGPPFATCMPYTPRLSPDGKLLATLVTRVDGNRQSDRLTIQDVATGRVLREFQVSEGPYPGMALPDTYHFWGYEWSGPRSVRLAEADVPIGSPDKLREALELRTFTV